MKPKRKLWKFLGDVFFIVAFILALLVLFAPLLFAAPAAAKHAHPERYYQEIWCAEAAGQTEVVLTDGTRCDCVTRTHAIEFDFAGKWAESIGQALHYARHTGKRAGVVLILERPRDVVKAERVRSIARRYCLPLDVWVTGPAAEVPMKKQGALGK